MTDFWDVTSCSLVDRSQRNLHIHLHEEGDSRILQTTLCQIPEHHNLFLFLPFNIIPLTLPFTSEVKLVMLIHVFQFPKQLRYKSRWPQTESLYCLALNRILNALNEPPSILSWVLRREASRVSLNFQRYKSLWHPSKLSVPLSPIMTPIPRMKVISSGFPERNFKI
jgi:hypothetical protein